jgi:putative restriction endonuclease
VTYALLCAQHSRDLLRTALIETYFAPEPQPALVEQGLVNLEAFHYSQALLAQARAQQRPTDAEHPCPAARDQGFRRAIVRAYDHRCALCGLRMLTPDGHTAVEAAHIIPWSTSYDDAPSNTGPLTRGW